MDGTLQVFDRVLSFAGISIFAKGSSRSKGWMIIQTFNFFLGFLTFIFTTGFVISNVSDLLLCIQGACVWTTGVIMFISLGICLVYRNDFKNFVNEMAFKDQAIEMPVVQYVLSRTKEEGKTYELKNLVTSSQTKLFRLTQILLKAYVASVWFCATLYLCGPIYQMSISDNRSLRLLAYPGLQSMIILLVGQIIRQLKIITFILSNLHFLVLEINGGRDENWQVECTMVLSQCIQHYIKIKRFSNRLNKICQPFYLTLILVATMLVCMCSVKIVISEKFTLYIMKYYVHEFCFISVVFMFCYLGQQVENQCELLEKAVLEKWYIYDRKHKKNVLIFKMALDRRMPIYIFGSITLSLPTFTWFIKTGMSFFTLVMSVIEN